MASDKPLDEIAELMQIPLGLAVETAKHEDWDFKKEKFQKLSVKERQNLETLELLFGRFQNEPDKKDFVVRALSKFSKLRSEQSKDDKRKQKIAQLTEYGMTEEQAEEFVKGVEKELGTKKSRSALSSKLEEFTQEQAEATIEQKIDAAQSGYRLLVSQYNSKLADFNASLELAIKLYCGEVEEMIATKPLGRDFQDIVSQQRSMSYNAQSMFKLMSLYLQMSGMGSYINHHSACSRLHSNGYAVIRKDRLAEMAQEQRALPPQNNT